MKPHLPNFEDRIVREVAVIMKIAREPWMQGWPVEICDAARVEEFLEYCEKEICSEYRSVMAEVLLVSLDEAFSMGRPSEEILSRAAGILAENSGLLEYWKCPDADSEEEMFPITPWIRSLHRGNWQTVPI